MEEEEDVGEDEHGDGGGVEDNVGDDGGGVEEDAEVEGVDLCGSCLGDEIELAVIACLACMMMESIACPSLSRLNFPRIEVNSEIVCARFGAGQLLSVICVVSSPVVSS